MASVSDTLRTALRTSGQSRYSISMATGIPQSVLSKFAAGDNLRGRNIDLLAAHLKMELRPKKTRAKTASAKKGGR